MEQMKRNKSPLYIMLGTIIVIVIFFMSIVFDKTIYPRESQNSNEYYIISDTLDRLFYKIDLKNKKIITKIGKKVKINANDTKIIVEIIENNIKSSNLEQKLLDQDINALFENHWKYYIIQAPNQKIYYVNSIQDCEKLSDFFSKYEYANFKYEDKSTFIEFGMPFMIVIILLCISPPLFIPLYVLKKSNVKIEGTLIDVRKIRMGRYNSSTHFIPVVKYQFNGIEYEGTPYTTQGYISNPTDERKVNIFIDPNNPETFFYAGNDENKKSIRKRYYSRYYCVFYIILYTWYIDNIYRRYL